MFPSILSYHYLSAFTSRNPRLYEFLYSSLPRTRLSHLHRSSLHHLHTCNHPHSITNSQTTEIKRCNWEVNDENAAAVQLNIKQLNLAADTLENAITSSNSSVKTSSLRLLEKLLLSFLQNPFSSFLLSLIYTLCQRPIDASLALLNLFETDPSVARSKIAPQVFEEIFLINFLPVLEWYNEQRSRILSSLSSSSGYESDDENSIVTDSIVSCTTLLSKMNGNQASELKELERDYEQVLDENCRVFVGYFKEILGNKDDRVVVPPSVVLEVVHKGDQHVYNQDEKKSMGIRN
ncbi:hypothetical protein L2E82_05628 [Cichorium intybus]|uniref:Uncharacterized protein n=1 Tax=Cichorium intybus TaxID=13427 RepID=A0ACB9H9C5_CICIN|nr:hypothetical protein L2E82_05628 [Cichorium intybus]